MRRRKYSLPSRLVRSYKTRALVALFLICILFPFGLDCLIIESVFMVYFVCCCLYSFLALCNVAVSASESHQSVVAFGFFLLLFFGASDLHFRSQFAGFQKKIENQKKMFNNFAKVFVEF